ncbi:MAG: hypothetical protein CME39_06750 [Haliea sp.]|nr:hypothetical protein [Haliea sp.]|tara:strand:- start:4201 stop:4503 length:303 start_codon:yes stop_codon:yes gene_type:complete
MLRPLISILLALGLIACSDSSDNRNRPLTPPDFTAADAWLNDFVANQALFTGASMAIVEQGKGVIHRNVFGDHTDETVSIGNINCLLREDTPADSKDWNC